MRRVQWTRWWPGQTRWGHGQTWTHRGCKSLVWRNFISVRPSWSSVKVRRDVAKFRTRWALSFLPIFWLGLVTMRVIPCFHTFPGSHGHRRLRLMWGSPIFGGTLCCYMNAGLGLEKGISCKISPSRKGWKFG